MTSSTTKIKNNVAEYEKESDKYIPPQSYYIIALNCIKPKKSIKELINNILNTSYDADGKPLVVYIFGDTLHILFSSIESHEHQLKGSHHAIVSAFVSNIQKQIEPESVSCFIIEFITKTNVLAYFQVKIHDNALSVASEKLKTTKNELSKMPFSEISGLAAAQGIKWEELKPAIKFGAFHKLADPVVSNKSSKLDRQTVTIKSELISQSNMDKFMSYLFD